MTRGFLPNTDSGLLGWSANFLNQIETHGYGVPADQRAAYAQLHENFAAALRASVDGATRGPAATLRKNTCRAALKALARRLGKLIGGQLELTDQQRLDLGLTIPKQRSRIEAPAAAPEIEVESVRGRGVRVWLRDAENGRPRLPEKVALASVFYFVGEQPPADPADWVMAGTTTRARLTVELAADVRPGSMVWLTACWLNPRSQRGPSANPKHTYTQFGGVMMRLAA